MRHDFSFGSGERQVEPIFDNVRRDHRLRYGQARKWIAQRLGDPSKVRGLDLFCGSGYGTWFLAESLGCRMTGIDGSAEAIAFAHQHFALPRISYICREFPFDEPLGSYNFIVCFESLEHVSEDAELLSLLVSCLDAHCVFALSVPNQRLCPLDRNRSVFPFHRRHYYHPSLPESILRRWPDLKLADWMGQDVYVFDERGVRVRMLSEPEMDLRPQTEGQVMVYLFSRR